MAKCVALILSGGGARASYQVGVLRGVTEIIGPGRQPFSIICGTSAGAINAAYLAAFADRPDEGIPRLYAGWRSLHASRIYDTSWSGVVHSLGHIVYGFLRGGGEDIPSSVLDNYPLRGLLADWIDFDAIHRNLASGVVRALAITAMNYSTGESVAFHEGRSTDVWQRVHRRGQPSTLDVAHVMASSAIPILFPPQLIAGQYYGDGALRQLHPLSPALHLGATDLFIIGVSSNKRSRNIGIHNESPTIAQMAGHLLNREFIDNLEADIEHAEKINELVSASAPPPDTPGSSPVNIFVVTPSISFDEVAARYIRRQPRSMRMLFRMIGARGRGAGASFASYLMFDGGFCTELIDAGYRDAMENTDAIRAFLN